MRVRSLRVRLMLMFMLVLMITLGAFTVFAFQAIREGAQSYVGNVQADVQADDQKVNSILMAYQQPRNVQRVQTLVDQLASQSRVRIIVMDHNQRIIADSAHALVGQTLTISLWLALDKSIASAGMHSFPQLSSSPPNMIRILSTDGRIVTFGQPSIPSASNFLNSIFQLLLLAVLVAGLVAFALTITLSRAILKPVRALTLATRRMEQGDFSQRVSVKKMDEIGDLAHAFNTMAESIERSGQLHRNLVSDIAHELRNPLNNVLGYLEALQDQVIEPDPQVIASLQEETILLSRLVTDLQDLTLAEAGQLHLQCVPIALEDTISNAVNSLLLQAKDKNLSLYVNVPPDLPLVEADPQRVGQILRNLLSNAIRYTPMQGEVCERASGSAAGGGAGARYGSGHSRRASALSL